MDKERHARIHTYMLTCMLTYKHPHRLPSFKPCQDLCASLGIALISTSANISGKKSLKKYRDVCRLFYNKSKIMKGRIGYSKKPSTIQDLQTGKIIRS